MRDCITMGNLCCTKKTGYESRQRALLREQNAYAFTIIFAEELCRERDNGPGLLGGVCPDEKMHFVQSILFSCLSVRLRVWLGNWFRFAEDFFPGAHP